MWATPLHHKPIVYGSTAANLVFFAAVVAHVLPAIVAPVAAIVALASRKGGPLHVRAGQLFVWSMAAVAITGIGIDLARLCFHVAENHTKYAGYSMPSSYPARIGFLYAGLCVLYLLREAAGPRVFAMSTRRARRPARGCRPRCWPWASLRGPDRDPLQPLDGALWMVATFCAFVAFMGRARLDDDRRARVARHRIGMIFLAAFSWWGAFQGFGPAIGIALRGADASTAPYRGGAPGPFTPLFWVFLATWAPVFLLGGYLVRRLRRRSRSTGTCSAGAPFALVGEGRGRCVSIPCSNTFQRLTADLLDVRPWPLKELRADGHTPSTAPRQRRFTPLVDHSCLRCTRQCPRRSELTG